MATNKLKLEQRELLTRYATLAAKTELTEHEEEELLQLEREVMNLEGKSLRSLR